MNEIDHTYWYLTRASGFVAYLLLFLSVSLGLSMTGDVVERWLRRHRLYDFHRFLSLLTLGVVVFHTLIVLPDAFIGFSVGELLLPFASPYRPEYMALGVFALYLTGFIVASFYLRHLIGYQIWRWLHYATFVAFAMALVHGIGAGTDTEAAWAQYLYASTGLIAFNLLIYRALKGSARGIRHEADQRPREPNRI
ncbi:MAG: iron reductase [Dehalococcoidia bacterium]|nr:iron reductase [Dehalococcoidia bacterium]